MSFAASAVRRVPRRRATSSLGLPTDDSAAVARLLEKGLAWSALQRLVNSSGLPLATIAQTLRIPPRTLVRRRARGRLSFDESERLLRLAGIVEKVIALFEEDTDGAVNWLSRPQDRLGGQTPLQACRTEIGAREVEDLIGRLEHGVFS